MSLRVLIVDDEPIARERLRLMLHGEADVEVVGAAASGAEAARLVHHHTPDLVLLDIQMPDGDGFDVIERIGEERMPDVVFVTAYDEHAVRAFEVHAVDYLLKPFDQERLAAALARVRMRRDWEAAAARAARFESAARLLVERAEAGGGAAHRLIVRDGDRVRFIDPAAITWIESAGNYVKVHANGSTCIVRHTLTRMAERLDRDRFARIHRSALVNLDRVVEMRHWSSGQYMVELDDGTTLRLSRTYRDAILKRFADDAG